MDDKFNDLEFIYNDTRLNMDKDILVNIREQRHNFANDIQVIWGYLQIGRVNEAKDYIRELNKRANIYNSIFKIGNPSLCIFLYKNIAKAFNIDVNIDFESSVGFVRDDYFIGCNYVFNYLDILFEKILEQANCGDKMAYIDIFNEDNILYIELSSSNYTVSVDKLPPVEDKAINNCIDKKIKDTIENIKKVGNSVYLEMDNYELLFKVGLVKCDDLKRLT
jgi:sensor histidine kinase regulating citrate/malate metabolism